MSLSVAMASGSSTPVFSPSQNPPYFCKTPTFHPPPSPQALHAPHASLLQKYQPHMKTAAALSIEPKQLSVLNRKRPSSIAIPVTARSGCFSQGDVTVRVKEVADSGDGYSVFSKRGRKSCLEDRFCVVKDFQGDSSQAFYGVFDGHGGAKAAEFVAKNIDRNIAERMAIENELSIQEALRDGYLKTDADFNKEDACGGTCCVTAMIHKGDLVVSNVGDCRAILSRGGVAEALTSDHCPSAEDERKRVEALGGYVDCRRGVCRVQGSLAVSRSIGDQHLKPWVTAEPETKIVRITPECEFLILASDGLWDKVTNQEAVNVVRPSCVGVQKPDLLSASKKLVDMSIRRGSIDDITVTVIDLGAFISRLALHLPFRQKGYLSPS